MKGFFRAVFGAFKRKPKETSLEKAVKMLGTAEIVSGEIFIKFSVDDNFSKAGALVIEYILNFKQVEGYYPEGFVLSISKIGFDNPQYDLYISTFYKVQKEMFEELKKMLYTVKPISFKELSNLRFYQLVNEAEEGEEFEM